MPGVGTTDSPYDLTPGLPGSVTLFRMVSASASFVDMHQKPRTVTISIENADFDMDDVKEWAEAVAELSNAALVGWDRSEKFFISLTDARAFDEGYSSVNESAVFTYQHNDRASDTIRAYIPAPDQSWFAGGAIQLDDAGVEDFLTKTAALIGGSYNLVGAYINDGTGRKKKFQAIIEEFEIEEPGIGDQPGEGPGNNPIIP